MNAKVLIAAALATASLGAFAGELYEPAPRDAQPAATAAVDAVIVVNGELGFIDNPAYQPARPAMTGSADQPLLVTDGTMFRVS